MTVYGEEAGAGIIGSQWLEELFEGRMEAESYSRSQQTFGGHDTYVIGWADCTTLSRAGQLLTLVVGASFVYSPHGRLDSPASRLGGRMRMTSSAPDPLQYVQFPSQSADPVAQE